MAGSIVKAVASAPPEIEYVSVSRSRSVASTSVTNVWFSAGETKAVAPPPLEVITGALFPLPALHSTWSKAPLLGSGCTTRRRVAAPSARRTSALPLTQPGRFDLLDDADEIRAALSEPAAPVTHGRATKLWTPLSSASTRGRVRGRERGRVVRCLGPDREGRRHGVRLVGLELRVGVRDAGARRNGDAVEAGADDELRVGVVGHQIEVASPRWTTGAGNLLRVVGVRVDAHVEGLDSPDPVNVRLTSSDDVSSPSCLEERTTYSPGTVALAVVSRAAAFPKRRCSGR